MILATPWLHGVLTRRTLVLCASIAAVALIGGADRIAASTSTHCNDPLPTGRHFCVTIKDQDNVSPSGTVGSGRQQVNVTAYQFYEFSIENLGGSTLTNGFTTLVLTDHFFTGAPANSKAVFVASGSASFCSATKTNPNTVACSLPNIPAGATLTFTVSYRTSDAAGVKETRAAVEVGFKEGSTKQGANPATKAFTEITDLEPNPDQSVAWSPPGQNVSLGTSPTFDTGFSVLQYKVPANTPPFVATLTESDGFVCAPGESCFGELVTTVLPESTAFSSSNLFHLKIVVSSDVAPGGNLDSFVVSHRFDDGTFEVLTADDHCSANPPASTDPLPCFLVAWVKGDGGTKFLVFDIYAFENGGWMPG